MRSFLLSAPFLAAYVAAASESTSTTTHIPACTATSSSGSGAFFDLRADIARPAQKGKQHTGRATKDYYSKGYDYGKNFTLNICGAVIDPVTDVTGVDKGSWANVSAYYTSHGDVYSIGSESMDLVSRGRKLVLQYTGGSPCGSTKPNKSSRSPSQGSDMFANSKRESVLTGQSHHVESLNKEEKDDDEKIIKRKSTTISFLCDRDPTATQAGISFVGTDPEECAYFFEARSVHACASAEPHKPGSVGPGSVFGLILVIAVLVYALGGVFYNRTVTNARGWRQLPNYSLWAGIWSFVRDMFIILFSSCARCIPGRRGYSYLNTSPRHRNSDAENRLIDQLDEEWDD